MSAPILSIRNLSIRFEDAADVVRNVSIDVHAGETVAIVGESGSGKSVTALSTASLLPESATITGSTEYRGEEILGADQNTLQRIRGNDISFIFQEPMTSLNPLHTIEKQVAESLSIHQGITRNKARPRVIELLEKVGIDDPRTRLEAYPHQLSGGQRQRVMIAMALANKPGLLIADEPTTALDVTIQAQILKLLADLQRREGMGMLFITHDLNIVRRIADRVCVMKNGEIIENGPTSEIFNDPQHEYTKILLAAGATGQPDAISADARTVLDTKKLRIWFPIKHGILRRTIGHVKAVNDASFTIREGETLGIVGESGSGKTTVALAILRLITSEGAILFNNVDISKHNNAQMRLLRKDIQIVFQDPYGSLSPRLTVEQIIAEGLGVHDIDRGKSARELVSEIMIEVGLEPEMMERYPHEFSGGERQRIAVARAMILRPKLLVLDEPTSALDMTVQSQIIDLLRELQRKYQLTYLFISHDLNVVRALSHKVLVMKNGDIVESGDVQNVFKSPQTDYTKELMAAAFDQSSSHSVSG